jgi:hypothetical protein
VGAYGREVLDWLDLKGEQRICVFGNKDLKLYGKWSQCDGFMNSDPTYPHRDGPINITPIKEFNAKLSKKERRRLRKEAAKSSSSTGYTSGLHGAGYGYDWEGHWKNLDRKNESRSDYIAPTGDPTLAAAKLLTTSSRETDEPKPDSNSAGSTPKVEVYNDKLMVKGWPAPGASRDDDETQELPIVDVPVGVYWRADDINEILQELRIFNWRTFNLMRPKMPRVAS